MALRTGRAGATTPRDERVFEDLFWTRFLSTRQIAELRFPSLESARVRMYALMRKGWVVNQILGPNEILWRLTREGFERVRTSLDWDREQAPDFFSGQKLRHYVESNDLYVLAAPGLERVLGGYPAWGWVNEGRAHRRYEFSGRRLVHQPDAEIRLPGYLFFLERQSRRARYGAKTIREKVAAYGAYVDRVLRPEGLRVEILFACDLERERRVAVEAGYEYGVEVVTSSVRGIASHLESVAASS